MLKVGLTGGIAAGKSVVGEMFAVLGAHVIQADEISHQLMQPGETVYREVVSRFGPGILNPDGIVDRARLAELAFGNQPSRVQELNQIVHPAVIRRQQEWMEQVSQRDPHAVAMVEAALILEASMVENLDRLVVVTCRPEQRIERWARRLKADYVIDNSGSLNETRRQVEEVYAVLKKEAES